MIRLSYPIINIKCTPLLVTLFLLTLCTISSYSQSTTTRDNTLPKSGRLLNNKPTGKGWVNLLSSPEEWNFESAYWQLTDGALHGKIGNEKEHHYGYTKKSYSDFELLVSIKMVGDDNANSGVCIRINPTNYDDAPGYQVDMGKGYWGSLWEERKAGMVQKYPDSLATKIVNRNEWNEYYIIAKGHHIEAWLNGVKTIDVVHDSGFTEGKIGFQLCHMHNPTTVDVKALYVREMK
jgi:hypothetical protein